MSWMLGAALYFVFWWILLFITLPFKMRAQIEEEGEIAPGTDPGAPVKPQILKRMIWNTILTSCVFLIYWLLFFHFGFGLRDLPSFL